MTTYGVKLQDVHWYQAGANDAGRDREGRAVAAERRQAHPRRRQVAERDARLRRDRLRDHRAAADLLPAGASRRRAAVSRLSWDGGGILRARPRSGRSCTSSRCRSTILDENPWVARNLYNAFLESKRRSIERLLDPAVSRYPLAWLPTYARQDARHVRRRPVPVRDRAKTARRSSNSPSTPSSRASRTGW